MKQLFNEHSLVLMEASINELIRRDSELDLHPTLANAPLIYSEAGRAVLEKLYQSYIDIAAEFDLPILLCTPTWRASRDRVEATQLPMSINVDAAHFMQNLRAHPRNKGMDIFIGGLSACKNDCYLPEQGLSGHQAQEFHRWQIDQLVQGGVDYLIAATLPNIEEALGIAQTMEKTGLPYIISFVISREGRVLDGTRLIDAIGYIDRSTDTPPLAYTINCAYPGFIHPEKEPAELFKRLLGYQANGSSLDHCDLENASDMHAEPVETWGELMVTLNRDYGVKMLGGCCGTGPEYLRYIAGRLAQV